MQECQKKDFACFDSAHQLTQFMRGELFIALGSLLSYIYNSTQEIKEAH